MKYPQAYKYNIWLHIFPDQYASLAKQVPPSITIPEARQQYIRQLSVRTLANPAQLSLHFKTLSPLQQTIIQLHFVKQLSCPEIAHRLQLPPTKIKKQLTAALISLRMKMNPSYYASLRRIMKTSTPRHKSNP